MGIDWGISNAISENACPIFVDRDSSRPKLKGHACVAAENGEFGTGVARMLVRGGDVPMVEQVDAEGADSESHITRDDPPQKVVVWFWVTLIGVTGVAIFFAWPNVGTGEYYPVGEYYSGGYYQQELPNPNFHLQHIVAFLLAGILGGAVIKLSLAAIKLRDLSRLASFLAIVGAAFVAALFLKYVPDPWDVILPLNDFPFFLLFIMSLIEVLPGEALCVILRWCYGKVAMFLSRSAHPRGFHSHT
jgi:hypothetical protein